MLTCYDELLKRLGFMTSDQHLKLNLGCGNIKIPGFVNIDSSNEAADLKCSFFELPYQERSVDLIYMCHSLEHICLNLVPNYLSYLSRLLRANGQLYISVPDFEILSSIYLSRKVSLAEIVRAIHGGQEYEGNTHYISFDYDLLSTLLAKSGFSKIQRYDPSLFLPHGVQDTSTYMIKGFPISLNILAYSS